MVTSPDFVLLNDVFSDMHLQTTRISIQFLVILISFIVKGFANDCVFNGFVDKLHMQYKYVCTRVKKYECQAIA